MAHAHIEIHHGGQWHLAGTVRVNAPEYGFAERGHFDYQVEYAATYLQSAKGWQAVSCQLPVNFANYSYPHWPAFLLDLLPTGAGRRQLLEQHQLTDGPGADWALLLKGAGSPPGNLRVREAAQQHTQIAAPDASGQIHAGATHPGFTRKEIIERGEHFIEYAFAHGALTANASDVQGEAPKFLLVEDHHSRWHAEGAIPDDRVKRHWLVKFPRGKTQRDRQVLKNECAYLELTRALGLHVGEPLEYQSDTLFIPRFDRQASGAAVVRRGLESLCSAAGIATFGASPPQEQLLDTIARFSDKPGEDIIEFVGRDIANIALGNKDNHARNSALLKLETGRTRLSPLFDFAPMFLDPEMIPRVCRWQADREVGGQPIWLSVCDYIVQRYQCVEPDALRTALHRWLASLQKFEDLAKDSGVDEDIISMRRAHVRKQCELLGEIT